MCLSNAIEAIVVVISVSPVPHRIPPQPFPYAHIVLRVHECPSPMPNPNELCQTPFAYAHCRLSITYRDPDRSNILRRRQPIVAGTPYGRHRFLVLFLPDAFSPDPSNLPPPSPIIPSPSLSKVYAYSPILSRRTFVLSTSDVLRDHRFRRARYVSQSQRMFQ